MQFYQNSSSHLQEAGAVPLLSRIFRLSVCNSPNSVFAADDALLSTAIAREGNAPLVDVALKVQIISDPTQVYAADDNLLQFFVVEGSRSRIPVNPYAGILYRRQENGTEVPVAFLAPAEVRSAARGAGVSVDLGAFTAGVIGDGISSLVTLSQAAYDALDPPDESTVYLIV